MFIAGRDWRSKVLTAFTLTRDVRVARFHSAGLRRFGIFAADRTTCAGTANSSIAVCLFGDRLPPGTFHVEPTHPETRAFTVPRDAEWLAQIALDMKVVIRPR